MRVIALCAVLAASCPLWYVGAYLHARTTRRLVHYAGGFVGRPDALHGLGFSQDGLVFAPMCALEVARPGHSR